MMKRINRYLVIVLSILCLVGCGANNDIFDEDVRHQLWLSHNGADLPITVDGNTASKVFCILLHGGPGGSAQEFNSFTKTFTDEIENDYAMVYYDQRYAGLSRGDYDPSLNTVVQHIDDLDQVISLLYLRYGEDIQIALMGHSWGGFLSAAYLLDPVRASRVITWINIDGAIHRTNFLKDDMQYIIDLADQEIQAGESASRWSALKNQATAELNRNISPYNFDSQNEPFRIVGETEVLIFDTEKIVNNSDSAFDAIYFNNYQPFIAAGNDFRDADLIQQDMFDFDATMDANISNITLPTLNIYGFWDVRTAPLQGQYVMDSISTPEEQKLFVMLEDSGHSPMINEPVSLAETILDWLELYL